MDLVRELKEVRFELSLRGYDCEAVDAFLARLRSDIATVQGDNDTAQSRIAELEGMIQDGGGSTETEGTLRRTLVLAQRLADETEAEAKKAATEMVDRATNEAADLRTAAEAEAASKREVGESELNEARDEASSIRDAANEEAATARAEARVQCEAILAEAETRGVERVATIEQTAQEESATMREPIRAEVAELESVRTRLLTDISALESHLEQQRVRVRTAVEALRVGMSGSIDDLERVAEDDELLATQPAPPHSEASLADVEVAPDIEIAERVQNAAPDAPSIDEVEAAGIANAEPIEMAATEVADLAESDDGTASHEADVDDGSSVDVPIDADEVPVDGEVIDGALDDEAATDLDLADFDAAEGGEDGAVDGDGEDVFADVDADDADVVEMTEEHGGDLVEEAVVVEADAFDGGGPATERIPVVAIATEDDLAEAELVDLDEEPSALFGTEVGDDAVAEDLDAAEGDPVAAVVDDSGAFVDRFAEALDVLPVSRDS